MVKVGDRIRERLAVLGISQSEVARRTKLSQGTIGGLLSGKARSSAHLHKIARELGTTAAYLSGETDDPHSEVPAELELDSDERRLIGCYRDLTAPTKAALMQVACSMASNLGRRDHSLDKGR